MARRKSARKTTRPKKAAKRKVAKKKKTVKKRAARAPAAEVGVRIGPPEEQHRVVVKFKADAGVRHSARGLASVAGADLSGVEACLKKFKGASFARLFADTEDSLERQVARVAAASGEALPSLSRYYEVTASSGKEAEDLRKSIEREDVVESAYVEPPSYLALFDAVPDAIADEAPPATPDFTAQQGYLGPATAGVDALYGWTLPGGKGNGVRVIDVEGAWNWSHEDQLQNQGGTVCGTNTTSMLWENHGTAVVGEIGGDENAFGVTGIAPAATVSGSSIFGSGMSSAAAIKCAADRLSAGEVILLELHRPGPEATGVGQQGFIAIEFWDADFAAIKYATSKGIIVVEAAGNGAVDLDAAVYGNKFNRSTRDSGAILVGAGAPPSGNHGPDRSRLGFSNWGAIIDAQGWGREVVSTGYGTLQGGSDKNKWYTNTFSGTSSASPIVVGVVAVMQGVRKAAGQPPFTFAELRSRLRSTGSPQQDGPNGPKTQRIGNRPNLRQLLPAADPCKAYRDRAARYLAAYRRTGNRAYLCGYYRYMALYYRCRYTATRNQAYQCAYFRYLALYFRCRHQVTSDRRYLCSHYRYVALYFKCQYLRSRDRKHLCQYYRYMAAYHCCTYRLTGSSTSLSNCRRFQSLYRGCS